MKISKRSSRQIKNLGKYCTFDTENKIAYVPLHYDTPEDLLDAHLSWPGKPVISDDAVDYLRDVASAVPDMFAVEISLTVDDYGLYTHDQLMDALKVTLENTFYFHDEKRRQNNVLSVFFIIVGFLALTIEVIGGIAGWFGERGTIARSIIETLTEIATWVFLWEGCALLLLTYENESTIFSLQMQRFHKVSFRDSDGRILISMDKEKFYEGWIYLGKKEAFARGFILFSNAIFLAALILHIVDFITSKPMLTGLDIALYAADWILIVLLVVSNISFYLDRGKMKKYALAFSGATLVYNILNIVLYEINLLTDKAYFGFNCIFVLGLIVNTICICYMKKQTVEV